MADIDEIFATLEDALGNGVSPIMRQEGDSSASLEGSIKFSFKNVAGQLTLPRLTSDGKLVVDTEAEGGAFRYKYGKLNGTLTLTDSLTITLENDITYKDVTFLIACLQESYGEVVWNNDGVETVLTTGLVGAGQYSFRGNAHCLSFATPSTGTQELIIRAKNFEVESDIRTALCAFGVNGSEGIPGSYLVDTYLTGSYLAA